MNPGHFLAVYQVETERLFRRATAIAGLIFAALFGLSGPIIMWLLNLIIIGPGRSYGEENLLAQGATPEQIESMLPSFWAWDSAVFLTYYMRSFMFLPILIFLLGGLVMASEFASRSTREDVLRPAPRWTILLGKWGALLTWILAASLLTSVLSSLGGLALLQGFELDEAALVGVDSMNSWEAFQAYFFYVWNPVSGAVFMVVSTFCTDLGFATLALCVAVLTRSVAATVASLVMVFMAQLAVWVTFGIATNDFMRQAAAQQTPWMSEEIRESLFGWLDFFALWQPPSVLGTCTFIETPWEGYITLLVITVFALVVGMLRFETMDVP